MTHVACPDCGLRFSAEFAAREQSCPMCLGPLKVCATAAEVVGQQLYFDPPPAPGTLPPRRDGAS